MAALTESTLRQLSNTSAYPESGSYENDGDASDHDSLGLFQMRAQAGWDPLAELMSVDYQVRAFLADLPARTIPAHGACWTSPDGSRCTRAPPPKQSKSRPSRPLPRWAQLRGSILEALTGTSGSAGPVVQRTRW